MEFEPERFSKLYQTAHSKSRVDKRDIAGRKLRLAMLQKNPERNTRLGFESLPQLRFFEN